MFKSWEFPLPVPLLTFRKDQNFFFLFPTNLIPAGIAWKKKIWIRDQTPLPIPIPKFRNSWNSPLLLLWNSADFLRLPWVWRIFPDFSSWIYFFPGNFIFLFSSARSEIFCIKMHQKSQKISKKSIPKILPRFLQELRLRLPGIFLSFCWVWFKL